MRRPPVADPVAPVLLALAAILAGAKLGGDLAERIGQPAVLGELVVGILLGNLDLVGVAWFRGVAADHTIDVLAGLGVVLLLFEVGLESTVRDMLKVGGRSLLVAVVGVVTPWVLGWGVGALLLADHSPYVHAFLGATLTATSVGITARVLKDLGRAQSPEARDRKSTRLNSSHDQISYAVFCLKKKKTYTYDICNRTRPTATASIVRIPHGRSTHSRKFSPMHTTLAPCGAYALSMHTGAARHEV